MRSIRGGKGLGDALYVQSVARHLVKGGERVRALTAYPEVFSQTEVECGPFSRAAQIVAHYTVRKGKTDTDQFQDCCIQAGIREPVELKLDWAPTSNPLAGLPRPVILVAAMRAPMDRKDAFGASLLPNPVAMQHCVDRLKGGATLVQVGSGESLHELSGCHVDLRNRTTVTEVIDAAFWCDAMFGWVSFFVPLAESLNKPALFVWSRRGLHDDQLFVRRITPEKVIHRKDLCAAVYDDAPKEELGTAADELLLRARARC